MDNSENFVNPLIESSNDLKKDLIVMSSTKFSIKSNVADLDRSFTYNVSAVLYRRISCYKRNKNGLFFEFGLPLLTVLLGVFLSFLVNDNRYKGLISMDANLVPRGSKVYFNPEAIDKINSNVPIT